MGRDPNICSYCLDRNVNHFPLCTMCKKPIEKQLHADQVHGLAAAFADSCCSFGCLEDLMNLVDGEKCGYCCRPVVQRNQVRLKCQHTFHDKDCLFSFMLKRNPRFADPNKEYICPSCQDPICFEEVIRGAFEEGELDRRMIKETFVECAVCGSPEVAVVTDDELIYCRACWQERFDQQESFVFVAIESANSDFVP